MRKSLAVFCLISAAASCLPACALVNTYEKCGFKGCPGDAAITADVKSRLNQYPGLGGPASVDVQTLDHVVYLYGLVNTEFARREIEAVVKSAPGVTRVVNSIAVDNS
jgi:osmotically-inducible protein OsmY